MEIIAETVKMEERLLFQILSEYLQRPATADDFKKCKKFITKDHPEKYQLAFEGIELGTVEYLIKDNALTIKFIPKNHESLDGYSTVTRI